MDRCSLLALRYAAPKTESHISEKRANSSVKAKDVFNMYLENT